MGTHKNIKLLAWFNFFTDFKLYSAIAIIYFSKVTGSLALGMAIFSIASISDALFEVPTGILSDFIGRKNTIILGAVSATFYAILYAFGVSFWVLALGAIFEGLSVAFYSGNNDALLHDSLTETGESEKYHNYLGKLSSLFQFGLALGALLGSILATQSFAIVMWISAVSQIACLIIALNIKEPRAHIKKSANIYSHITQAFKLFLVNKKLRNISLAGTIGGAIGEATFQLQAAFYQLLWPLWAIGLAKMLSYIGASLSYFFSGKIIDKFGEVKILLGGNIYSRLINIVSVSFPSVLSPLFMSTTSLFYGTSSVSRNSLMQKEFTQHQRATMSSLDSLAGSLFFALFAYVFGVIGDLFGPAKTLLIAQFFAFTATYLYWRVFRREKNH